ncbi:family 10 glycosylhydrolase [filamentous cyanobacterium LEGE 11480]|uniref:Family 10 glycosylhydrolase n=1 Tax=Romeriopsis navalis LEGE 11480 TaxID=2777977 RepID=A0A928VLN8_9CYAN|nr:family 10 glycosylhydrolase [Romeriopsis navalis]MBE9030615.1 family 10 glycosylhydrolase [Romeriopsis navalis LEGE 11480]
MPSQKDNKGCGCANIPISLMLVMLVGGFWGFRQLGKLDLGNTVAKQFGDVIPGLAKQKQPAPVAAVPPKHQQPTIKNPVASRSPKPIAPQKSSPSKPTPAQKTAKKTPQTPWQKKQIRGIYLSRYMVTNNASEKMIRNRVRYFRKQGINTIIHGVWGNGCAMYKSQVTRKYVGYSSCPNLFNPRWLDWLLDEAHKQGMQVHAYFEKGIKLDENSPIFDKAVAKGWMVPGVDKTFPGLDHYLLDVGNKAVSAFYREVVVEFVKRYPTIDAVQWDDYLGYHAELPSKTDRTAQLTKFVRQMKSDMKRANPKVSFDICHHNPYWGKRYFAADWKNWNVDRAFIQNYSEANFEKEMPYIEQIEGVALTEKQFHRLKSLVANPKVKSILVFPSKGNPKEAAAMVKKFTPIGN